MSDKSREEMKHIYKKSFNRILQQASAFKWRLRQLSSDYVKNWDKVEYFFFNPETANFFIT
jgi:Na+-transporting NADH:ubiquinone oxidoreductase subunit NqrF